jgi:hypothetical protein
MIRVDNSFINPPDPENNHLWEVIGIQFLDKEQAYVFEVQETTQEKVCGKDDELGELHCVTARSMAIPHQLLLLTELIDNQFIGGKRRQFVQRDPKGALWHYYFVSQEELEERRSENEDEPD